MERSERGLSLIEVGLLLCLVGVVLAVAVPTFGRQVRTSKVSEAAEQLEALHQVTASYFGATWGDQTDCLPPRAGPSPPLPAQSALVVDFDDPAMDGFETWAALGFQPTIPIRFRYTFLPHAGGCGLTASESHPLVVLRAEGDLDGDGVLSLFERTAQPTADAGLVPTGVLHVLRRTD